MSKHFMINNVFPKTLWDKGEKCGGARGDIYDVRIWRIRVASWISKATCTHSHAHAHTPALARAHTLISNTYCFSTATMIRERALKLRYTYIACLVLMVIYSNPSSKPSNHSCRSESLTDWVFTLEISQSQAWHPLNCRRVCPKFDLLMPKAKSKSQCCVNFKSKYSEFWIKYQTFVTNKN